MSSGRSTLTVLQGGMSDPVAGGRIVARWTGVASDSVWIGGAGPETQRLRLEGDRMAGRSRLRPGDDSSMDAGAVAGAGAEPVPAVLRRVPCEP